MLQQRGQHRLADSALPFLARAPSADTSQWRQELPSTCPKELAHAPAFSWALNRLDSVVSTDTVKTRRILAAVYTLAAARLEAAGA